MSSKSASLKHARNVQKLDEYAPEEKIKGMFAKKAKFTLREWMERRQQQGKPIGYGYSGQLISRTMRKASV